MQATNAGDSSEKRTARLVPILLVLCLGLPSVALAEVVGEDGSVLNSHSQATRSIARSADSTKVGLPNVAIVASASSDVNDPWFSDPRDNILASGFFASVTVVHAGQVTPSLLELQTYDAVMVWSNFAFADSIQLGDNLADYVDGGGGVVLASFGNSSATPGRFLEGRWLSHGYDIIPSQSGTTTGPESLGTIHDPGHPLVANVLSFAGGASSFRPTNTTMVASADVVAEWGDGSVLVAVREDTVGSRVDLGFYPPSDAVLSSFWDATTDGYTLLANALKYTALRLALIPGDSDADLDIDSDDFANFEKCVTGNGNGPPLAGCVTFDLDGDGDVDCSDWTLIAMAWTGPPALPPLVDCNGNGIQDACDLAEAVSEDCSSNGIPDECEADCNGTSVADSCDILLGTSDDCNANGTPDECEPAQGDCNNNGVADGCDLTGGTSNDCNGSGVPDSCDITSGFSQDLNGDGVPDECCAISAQPIPAQTPMTPVGTEDLFLNRYLSFTAGDLGQIQAVRITFFGLVPPFDAWNGISMWVGPTRQVSEFPGVIDDTPPTVTMATLECSPHFRDWTAEGLVHVYHAAITPDGEYRVQTISNLCPTGSEEFYSIPFVFRTSTFGDLVGLYDSQLQVWTAPNGSVGVPTDVVAVIDKFRGLPDAPTKPRADLFPETPDQVISVSDMTIVLDAFRGLSIPFVLGPTPCSQ